MSRKAATPARRQTAKKQRTVVRKQRLSSSALSKRDREIQRFIRLSCDPNDPQGPGGACHLGYARPEAPIPLKQDLSVQQLDALADTCERKGYRMRFAGLVVVE
jgi:hypothetical protein